jgi:glucosyl-dolichyl phosphate glucuronosyltransferase
MNICVAICTWNRAEMLRKTLEKMVLLEKTDEFEWNLIVVNNNCTDNTDNVLLSFETKLPLKHITEPKPGLSNARNAAVRETDGDYVIWTDDDVLVDKNWLLAYVDAFKKWPEAAVFGGPVEPWFEGVPPKWLQKYWKLASDAFAARDFGEDPVAFNSANKCLPYGANYAIRMKEQKAHLYDPDLGIRGEEIVLGEETQVVKKILASGSTGWWVPGAKVLHWIPKNRQSFNYIEQYFMGAGKTDVRTMETVQGPFFMGVPSRVLLRYLKYLRKCYLAKIFRKDNVYIKYFIRKNTLWGQILEFRQRYLSKFS